MKIAVIYENDKIFVSYTPSEFIEELQELINDGYSVQEAMDIIITRLKKKTRTT